MGYHVHNNISTNNKILPDLIISIGDNQWVRVILNDYVGNIVKTYKLQSK